MAEALIKYETIDKYQIEDLMGRKPVREPQGWGDDVPPASGAAKPEHDESERPTDKKDNSSLGGAAEQN